MKRVYARVRTVSATLKLEFIAEGSRDCPLLLYGSAPEVVSALVRWLASDFKTLDLESFPGVEAVGGCRVAARMADRDLGVRQTDPTSFLWELSRSGWDQVVGLMKPFAAPSTPGDSQLYFQWLDKLRDVSLIISTGRRW
jgi:hypothetical protein